MLILKPLVKYHSKMHLKFSLINIPPVNSINPHYSRQKVDCFLNAAAEMMHSALETHLVLVRGRAT